MLKLSTSMFTAFQIEEIQRGSKLGFSFEFAPCPQFLQFFFPAKWMGSKMKIQRKQNLTASLHTWLKMDALRDDNGERKTTRGARWTYREEAKWRRQREERGSKIEERERGDGLSPLYIQIKWYPHFLSFQSSTTVIHTRAIRSIHLCSPLKCSDI